MHGGGGTGLHRSPIASAKASAPLFDSYRSRFPPQPIDFTTAIQLLTELGSLSLFSPDGQGGDMNYSNAVSYFLRVCTTETNFELNPRQPLSLSASKLDFRYQKNTATNKD